MQPSWSLLTGCEIVWFHFHTGRTTLSINYYLCSHRNNWKLHWGVPSWVPAMPVTTLHNPFNVHWSPCRELFSCCLYSDEGCTKPLSFIVRNFLISRLFVASLHAYIPLPALFRNFQSSWCAWCWLWCIYRHRHVLSHPPAGLSKLSYSGHLM